MKVTKKTRLLAAVPIAQSQDGTVKVFSVKDNGQATVFTYGHNWILTGRGLTDNGGDTGWSVAMVQLKTAPGADLVEMGHVCAADGRSLTVSNDSSVPPAAGIYENARIVLQLQKRDSMIDPEYLEIPLAKLIVE